MRSYRRIRALAAVVLAAGTVAPVAQARVDNGPYPFIAPAPRVVVHQGSGSPEWALIGGTVGGLTLLGAGAAASRRRPARASRIHTVTGA